METDVYNQFNEIMYNKSHLGPIAEKSGKNFMLKAKNPANIQQRIHYFAVGHRFKSIDTENAFAYMLDEELKKKVPTQFLALQANKFDFLDSVDKIKGLRNLLIAIRNINCHFVHTFDELKIDTINPKIIVFLKEAFYLSSLDAFLQEKELNYATYFQDKSSKEKDFITFLCEKFNKGKAYSHVDDIINDLLFIDVDTDTDYTIDGEVLFKVEKGKYLTFHACLFFLSMFLYKNEANSLISKIKGFKRADEKVFQSKRDIFTFFSKKLSSQDINSEEQSLVKFHDLIQYLNHYPTVWNKELELESHVPLMTNRLRKSIIEMEIDRSFPEKAGNNRFLLYAVKKLFDKNSLRYWDAENNSFSDDEISMSFFAKITPTVMIVIQ